MSKSWIAYIMIANLNLLLAEIILDRNESKVDTENTEFNTSRSLQSVKYGMTFGYGGVVLSTGQEIFGAHCWSDTWAYQATNGGCGSYSGDTPCTMSLPILCIKKMNFKRPCYRLHADPYYLGWSEGYLQLTTPIIGTRLTSSEAASKICVNQFGVGYRIAEFHDGRQVSGMSENNYCGDTWPFSNYGGGWGFYGIGRKRSISTRFWVEINDQYANCWN